MPAAAAAVKARHSLKNVDLPVQVLSSTVEDAILNRLPH